jgi:endogenous inhibitor of DNA gyrase (YacG/DUF329 family)
MRTNNNAILSRSNKYTFTCIMCQAQKTSQNPHTKFCSNECRNKRESIAQGRYTTDKTVSPASTGAMSELIVSADLLRKGYAVFRAVSPSCYCDIIAIKKDVIWHIEVRTGYKNPRTHSLNFPRRISENVNVVAVVERNLGEIYFLAIDLKTSLSI